VAATLGSRAVEAEAPTWRLGQWRPRRWPGPVAREVEAGVKEGGAVLDRGWWRMGQRPRRCWIGGGGERGGGRGDAESGAVEARAVVDSHRGSAPHGRRMSSTGTTA
jgi:hypothetical protein